MTATSENFEKDLLIKFREAYAEALKQEPRYKKTEELLLSAIKTLEQEITNV